MENCKSAQSGKMDGLCAVIRCLGLKDSTAGEGVPSYSMMKKLTAEHSMSPCFIFTVLTCNFQVIDLKFSKC